MTSESGMVPSRQLRNDTAGVLRRAAAGEKLTITVNGQPLALLTPLPRRSGSWLPRHELAARLIHHQADPGLRADLAELAGDDTDDLGALS